MSTTTTTTLTSPIGAVGSSGSYLVTGGGGSNMGSSGYLAGYGPTPSPVTITTGGTGYYSTPITTTNTVGWTTMAPNTANLKITGNNPKIQTDKSEIDLDETAELIKILKERLLILIPNFEKHEKYAALKKAYDHYKLIEAMLQEEKKDDK